ncbi:MAG: ABC transporter permease subunit [Dorea sp.]|nr:ABC transporter permease subunit [Dorea sp.]
MWIIWKEEFRKIAARKILWIAFFLLLGFAAFRLFIELGHYSVTIDGENFRGQEAVDKDKALTKQYAGILTEEKVNEIYYKYGFYPYSDPDNTTIEKNFLSKYITDTFTDANVFNPHFYDRKEWEYKVAPYLERKAKFDYVLGWNDFLEMYVLVLLSVYVILMLGLAPVFSEEYTLKTADIIRTTKRGKSSAVWMKILSACIFSIFLTCIAGIYLFLLYLWVYGTQGLDASAVFLSFVSFYGYCPETVGGLLLFITVMGILGAVLLTGITLAFSSLCRNSFLALVLSASAFLFPVLWIKAIGPMCMGVIGRTAATNVTHFMASMPAYLPMSTGFAFSGKQTAIHLGTASAVGGLGILYGYFRFRSCKE